MGTDLTMSYRTDPVTPPTLTERSPSLLSTLRKKFKGTLGVTESPVQLLDQKQSKDDPGKSSTSTSFISEV